jgi:hypothetical protein
MSIEIPQPIKLTAKEQKLASQIVFDFPMSGPDDAIRQSCELSFELMKLLLKRDAIPKARWDFFTVDEHNVGARRSRAAIFEMNGTVGGEIFRHANFLELHLPYILFGPQLPKSTIEGFCKITEEDAGTSGMVLDQLNKFVRQKVREHRFDKSKAADAFYLLAMEIGETWNARAFYDAAMSVRDGKS